MNKILLQIKCLKASFSFFIRMKVREIFSKSSNLKISIVTIWNETRLSFLLYFEYKGQNWLFVKTNEIKNKILSTYHGTEPYRAFKISEMEKEIPEI